jgi:hypothetical protein
VTAMDQPSTPAEVEALPIEDRAAAYLVAQQGLEARLELPGA